MPETTTWTIDEASALYGVEAWGADYVRVNGLGHIEMGPGETKIDLHDLVNGLRARGVSTPMVIRFRDVLEHRMETIAKAFSKAIDDNDYRGSYSAIYPIKVNQQRQICAEIRDRAVDLRFGFEAGSKPELLAVLGLIAELPPDIERPLIVCNGFKDDEYIETVVLASKLGLRIVTVIERAHELTALLRYASSYGIRPMIGVRIKPSSRGAGRWEESGGMRSKFGLNFTELLRLVDRLKRDEMLDCLQVLHFHVGSQICDIRRFKNAIGEL
ncbi:MAG: arginine decarboxylase, partial [Phycisphaerales bacterium]|nr:arginine decarboxylase [Phycisphaerales bacterium]